MKTRSLQGSADPVLPCPQLIGRFLAGYFGAGLERQQEKSKQRARNPTKSAAKNDGERPPLYLCSPIQNIEDLKRYSNEQCGIEATEGQLLVGGAVGHPPKPGKQCALEIRNGRCGGVC